MNRLNRAFPALLGLILLHTSDVRSEAGPPPEHETRAEHLFQEGKARMFDGDYTAACPMLAESFRLDPGTGCLLALALCQDRDGQIEAAHRTYLEAAARAQLEGDVEREQAARQRADELAGRPHPKPAPNEPEPAEAPQPVTSEVTAQPVPPLHTETAHRASPAKKAGVVLLGVAAASVATGIFFTLRSKVRSREAELACAQGECTTEALDHREMAHTAKDVAILSLIAGGSLGAAGLLTYLAGRDQPPRKRATARATPWASVGRVGLVLRGRF